VIDLFTGRYGSAPLHTERELRAALPESRRAADELLASILVTPARGCGGRVVVARGPWVLRHFGDGIAVPAGRYRLRELPWRVSGPVRSC
jgi:hypothetical protein